MNALILPDVASQTLSDQGILLKWVGMQGITLPVVHMESLHAHDAVAESAWNWGAL